MQPGRSYLGEFYSLLCALFWAIAVILFRKSGEQITPVALNTFKNTVALLLFLITGALRGLSPLPSGHAPGEWLTLLLSGAVGIGLADSFFFASLNRLGATGSAVVDCVYSPFVILCAAVYLGEPVGLSLFLAMSLMVLAILIGTWEPRLVQDEAARRQQRQGVILGVLSMFAMAAAIVMAKPVLAVTEVWWATPVRLLGGQIFLTVQAALPRHRAAVRAAFTPGRSWRYSLSSALLGSYLAMVIWMAGMKHALASVAGILNQTSTLIVPLLAALFLGEQLTVRKIVAVVLGFAGAVLAFA